MKIKLLKIFVETKEIGSKADKFTFFIMVSCESKISSATGIAQSS